MPHQQFTDSPSTSSAPQRQEHTPVDLEVFDPEPPEAESRRRFNLSTVQVGAGAGAAVTSALFASFFGVAGTLIGAAVGSIVSTVAGAIYAESLRRTAERVKHSQAIVVRSATATATVVRPAGATTVVRPAALEPVRAPWWRRRPVALGAMALATFALALLVVTGVEFVTHRTLSGGTGGTSVSRAFTHSATATTPTPSVTPTVSPSASPTVASKAPVAPATPSAAPTTTAPSTPAPSATPSATSTSVPSATVTP